jgi:hypothetical protein
MRTWTRHLVLPAVLLAVSLLFEVPAVYAQGRDPFLGEWMLNLEKSKFEGVAAPGRRVMIFEGLPGGGIKHATETNPVGGGIAGRNEYSAKFDSQDNHIAGSFLDTVALKRINQRTIERTGKVEGKVVETMTMTVSADGKTLTVVTKGTNPNTEAEYNSTQVFERRP